jgi:hypothetical protein
VCVVIQNETNQQKKKRKKRQIKKQLKALLIFFLQNKQFDAKMVSIVYKMLICNKNFVQKMPISYRK